MGSVLVCTTNCLYKHFDSSLAIICVYAKRVLNAPRLTSLLTPCYCTSHTLIAGITIAEKGELGGPGFGGCPLVSHFLYTKFKKFHILFPACVVMLRLQQLALYIIYA
jgi:hypothetical protein